MEHLKMKISNLNLNGVTPETWTALIWGFVVAINQALAIFGKEAIPFTENQIYQVVSFVITCYTIWINHWKNHSYTTPAQEADKVMWALESGELEYDRKVTQTRTDHYVGRG